MLALGVALVVAATGQTDPNRLPIGNPGETTVQIGQIVNLETARRSSVGDFVRAARGKRFVYLGENHATLDHQRMQAAVIEALVKDGRKVTVGLEMYQRPKQEWLDRWSAGELTSRDFQAKSDWTGQWGFPFYYYSPVFQSVKSHRLPLVALNVPRDWVRAVGRGGFAALPEDAKAQLPSEMSLANAEHKSVFQALIGGHPVSGPAMDNMYAAQVLWDEAMADSALRFLAGKPDDPKAVFVVIAGSGHVLYKQGINYRVSKRNGGEGITFVMVQSDGPTTVSRGIGDFVYLSETDREVTTTLPVGRGKLEVEVSPGLKIDAYTFKPATYRNGPLILVFHGTLRNADEYRNDSESIGRKYGAIVVAPRFDSQRFPGSKYNGGGILDPERKPAPKEAWTYALVPRLVEAIRQREGRSDLPYFLIGHSAGGQFLVRMAALYPSEATRIVAANPGSLLFPTTEQPFGYGYGDLPAELSNDDVMKAYLAQPLTLLLGRKDDHPDEYFDESPNAMRQGKSRFERGKNAFAFAKTLAAKRGWPFRWQLLEVPEVGHDHKLMFDSREFGRALSQR